MSSIWVVLIDTSGSMSQGFSGRVSDDPFVETGAWSTKIEAAKELLGSQIRASNVQEIAVVTFADQAAKIFHGTREEFLRRESEFMALEASSRKTNLAEALDLVREDPNFEAYDSISVLVLSDGLANVDNPAASAERLIDKYRHGRIDTILIDETEQGEAIARAISINGWVRPAFSVLQLAQGITESRAAGLSLSLSRTNQRRFALEYELAAATEASLPLLLSITTPIDLTPRTLLEEVGPVLGALEQIERVAAEYGDRPFRGRINSISQSSPISISLADFMEAVNSLLGIVIPWRRKHAKELALIREQRLRIENQKLEAEVELTKMQARRDAAHAENTMSEARLRSVQAEAQEERLHYDRRFLDMKLDVSRQILNSLAPEREDYNDARLYIIVSAVDTLLESQLEFEVQEKPEGPERRLRDRKT